MNTDQILSQAIHFHQTGQFGEAKALYRQILGMEPGNPSALHLLGIIVHQEGDLDTAEELIRAAIRHAPSYAEAHNNLGNLLRDKGRLEDALACHLSALKLSPTDCEIHFSLGLTYQAGGRPAEACDAYLRAVSLQPNYGAAWGNLGNVLEGEGRLEEALVCLTRAAGSSPGSEGAHYNLARLLQRMEHFDEAAAHYSQALNINPRMAEAWYNLGILQQKQGKIDAAVENFERALEVNPSYAEALNNLAGALKARGDIQGAIAHYRQTLALSPDDHEVFSNLLLALNYASDADPGGIYAEHRDFAERFEKKLISDRLRHANSPDSERKLCIAYLSPDFRFHPVANFIEPALHHHNRQGFKVLCLYNHVATDTQTELFKAQADEWWDIAGLTDETVAKIIQDLGVDILVDLAGHTSGNRLGVLARKPAPVQATWLGYLNTTGLAAVDWRLTDAHADPVGTSEAFHSERLMRLPHSQWCFHPFDGMPTPGDLPALKNAYVTFASFGNAAKITDTCLELWARVLQTSPTSHLLAVGVPEGWARDRIVAHFRDRGIEPYRLDFLGKRHLQAYWDAFSLADIALDTFPYNGGTTSCDALWQGLPVVSLSGQTPASRGGSSLLSALGRPEWIANSPEAFAETAGALAADIPALARTRAGLRQQMSASPLMDEKRFILDLEEAYRQMWRSWCQAR